MDAEEGGGGDEGDQEGGQKIGNSLPRGLQTHQDAWVMADYLSFNKVEYPQPMSTARVFNIQCPIGDMFT